VSLLDKLLAGRLAHGRLTICGTDGRERHFGDGMVGWPQARLQINAANAERKILLNPRLGLTEAIMDGAVSNDDIMVLVELVRRNNPWEKGVEWQFTWRK
jgi:cyclopropane-fatty-acyl-phospholipid synthase